MDTPHHHKNIVHIRLFRIFKSNPVNVVKIDKSLVMHMTEDPNEAQIVRSTIELAHNLGLKVIAEGVENREVWDCCFLWDAMQGYYLSRPLPAPETTKWFYDPLWSIAKANTLKHSNEELGVPVAQNPSHWIKATVIISVECADADWGRLFRQRAETGISITV